MSVTLCSHCALPVGGHGQQREVGGENHAFCCYGCSLAFQVSHGEREEPTAAWLLIRLGIGAFLAMNIMLFSLLLYSGTAATSDGDVTWLVQVLLWALATPVVVILGGPFFHAAFQAARSGRATADTLIAIGVLAAYGYSALAVLAGGPHVYFDTATMVLVLFTLGRYLEAVGRVRSVRSLAPMLAAERATATVVSETRERERAVADLPTGTVVRVRPGERVVVDGVVIEGHSACDEAVLTGQSEPRAKQPGACVYAGSINGNGQLLLRTSVAGDDTRWVRIGRAVREALSRKGVVGELIDRVAAVFVPTVILLATGTVWYWQAHASLDVALMAGLAVLVVACPCALGLAAPLASALGVGSAAHKGVLVRGGAVFERLGRVRAVAFDKTGTLTTGRLHVEGVVSADAPEAAILARAAALAGASTHPVARGIAASARERGLESVTAADLQEHPGQGVTGTLGGETLALGSKAFMRSLGWSVPTALEAPSESAAGCSFAYVGWAGCAHGVVSLADTTLGEAAAVVRGLRAEGISVRLLSGDSRAAAQRTAQAVGIEDCHAELSPEDKVELVRAWGREHGAVAMVGDGLNDGPVLAAATVGIAVGGATDLARESADITLPEGALARLPEVIRLARRVRGTIYANLGWALGYNVLALSLAAAGLLLPVIAAGLMAGSSLLVVVNSLRAGRESGAAEAGAASVEASAPASAMPGIGRG